MFPSLWYIKNDAFALYFRCYTQQSHGRSQEEGQYKTKFCQSLESGPDLFHRSSREFVGYHIKQLTYMLVCSFYSKYKIVLCSVPFSKYFRFLLPQVAKCTYGSNLSSRTSSSSSTPLWKNELIFYTFKLSHNLGSVRGQNTTPGQASRHWFALRFPFSFMLHIPALLDRMSSQVS